jgi:hypothetical protein
MKICDSHWSQLKTAIEERGLSAYVSKNGEAAVKTLVASAQGVEGKDAFDPLLQANFAIWGNALEAFGADIMTENAPCPLCALDHHATTCTKEGCPNETGADWIGFAADAQLENARQLGLLGKPN